MSLISSGKRSLPSLRSGTSTRSQLNPTLVALEIYKQVLMPYLRKIGAECRVEAIRSNQRKSCASSIRWLLSCRPTGLLLLHVIEADADLIKNAKDDRDVSYSFVHQLTRLTHDRGSLMHDDRVDVTAMAVQWFQEQAALDQGLEPGTGLRSCCWRRLRTRTVGP